MSYASPRSTRFSPTKRARAGTFELLQVVYARRARPDLGVRRGECGTVVEVFDEPRRTYYVEFVAPDGTMRAEGAFTPDELSVAPLQS